MQTHANKVSYNSHMPDTKLTKDVQDVLDHILIPQDKLQKRIKQLGRQISKDFAGCDLLLVCILRGGVMFLTDLMRAVNIPHAIDFMAVTSYGVGARERQGRPRISLDLNTDIHEKHVLIVEDIIDSGHTLSYVMGWLQTRNPASLKICTLLNTPSRREVDVPIAYTGFDIPNEFVFGYGLDLDELYRNLPFVGVAKT
jgi:hypoxanthine phosphoribosyltransferase